GTQNQEGIAGVTAAVEFTRSIGYGERALGERLWSGLKSMKHLCVFGVPPSQPRTPTFAFTVNGMTSEDVARALVKKGSFVSNADFYAATVVRELGVEGLVRAGCAAYTSSEEVERLLSAVDALGSTRR